MARLERHGRRARYVERSIALLYAAVVVFIVTCLAIALERALGVPRAAAELHKLPLVAAGLFRGEIIELRPFVNWSRLLI